MYSFCKHIFDEAPFIGKNNCTHKQGYRGFELIVKKCKELDKKDCEAQNKYCDFNFDEEPSLKNGCTHKNDFRKDEEKVNECKGQSAEKCIQYAYCKYNIDVAPSTEFNKCTHLQQHRNYVGVILRCKNPKDEIDCITQNGCKWNKDTTVKKVAVKEEPKAKK